MADPVTTYPQLVVSLDLLPTGAYQVELRFDNPSSKTEINAVKGEAPILANALLSLESDPKRYGTALGKMLFSDAGVLSLYQQVQANLGNTPLRVRLVIGPPDLHRLRWELLADPVTGSYLFTSDRVFLSRFMTSDNWRKVSLRAKGDLTALVAVSSPSNLAEYGLADVKLDVEIPTATNNLKGIDVTVVGQKQPCTLVNLSKALQEPVDILYLVCHGAYKTEPLLFLQGDDGKVPTDPVRKSVGVRGEELADMLSTLASQPTLVVLASCESAGSQDVVAGDAGSEAFHALAPLLAKAGVGAVVAMRGKISMETVKHVMPVFFQQLLVDGQVDRAIGAARAAALVARRDDAWMMALFMRIKDGRIWYEPGFAQDVDWGVILDQVKRKKFVAIAGSGVSASFYGDSRFLASELARDFGFPLAPHQRDDLPQVAQYLSVLKKGHDPAVSVVRSKILTEVFKRYTDLLPADMLSQAPEDASVEKLWPLLADRPGKGGAKNPYQILAELPGKVYISTAPDLLLAEALKKAGKKPQVLYGDWRSDSNTPLAPTDQGEPDSPAPVVYQMMGIFDDEGSNSLVLTEDDYFDYMIATAGYNATPDHLATQSQKQLLPAVVRSALVSNALMFLGFQLDDWSFRVLFRLIQSLEGSKKREDMPSVGVQVSPDEYSLADATKASEYLYKYYEKQGNISVYWGSAEDFLKELYKRYTKGAGTVAPQVAAAAAQAGVGEYVVPSPH